jgi:DNA-binding GntR family transcriptional regulator
MLRANEFRTVSGRGKSIADLVTDTLRRAIILRVLKLGERLVESKVAAELDVSITPLRHAFQKLSNEGLIEIFPYKGTCVVNITPEFIDDVCFCRNMVEISAAKCAYDNLVEYDPECLLHIIEDGVKNFNATQQVYDVIAKDRELHETIVVHARQKTLLGFWRQLSPRIMLLQSYAKKKSYNVQQFYERHKPIADALIKRAGKEKFVAVLQGNLYQAYGEEERKIILTEAAQQDKYCD